LIRKKYLAILGMVTHCAGQLWDYDCGG